MTETLFHLRPEGFGERERKVLEHPPFTASAFHFDSGVAAVRLKNESGEVVMLPFQGQQVWSANFGGRELTMKSMFAEPKMTRDYLQTYGGFLIHCGVTAMGVPGANDTHPLHGELPNAPFQEAYLFLGEDERGPYLGLGGRYRHTVAFSSNYVAEPRVKLYADSSVMSASLTVTNLKATPMELMYLAHINFRPVDNGRLVYSAKKDPRHVRVRRSIPAHVTPAPGYAEFLDELAWRPEQHHVLAPGLAFDPEVVFFVDYLADADGWAHTLQLHPDGAADYVRHRPEQLGTGVRWICRTPDQDALGMVDPATAEPEGYSAEKAKGNLVTLAPGEVWRCDYEMGALSADEAARIAETIEQVLNEKTLKEKTVADFQTRAPRNRLIGTPPKVGIRPAIDGRLGGVRESLEGQTMALAHAVASLITQSLRHADGLAVECVIADTTIGGVAEAARCAEKFAHAGVGVSLTVTPCWCYGSETMDMSPLLPKAVWGFNGTERPGAVYLAAVMAAHAQKGLPAFSIYGREVQDAGDTSIPDDVRQKLLQFTKAALAVATLRGKSYLSVGGVSMGIMGSSVDPAFFEAYLGMRVETVDMSEVARRLEQSIFDEEEFGRALEWVKETCLEGEDYNPAAQQQSREVKDEVWATSVKMALVMRDLMVGNPKLAELGHGEEALGHNAIAAGFQGQRQWTDFRPNGDFMEAILTSSFDWNGIRQPYMVATENDALNGVSMLFGHLLTNSAQIFADVRTHWSPEAVARVTGHKLAGRAAGGLLHLINSGPAALDGTGQQEQGGQPAMKPFWEVTPEEAQACLGATTWHAGMLEYFRGGGWSTRYVTRGDMPVTMTRLNLVKGLGPALQIAEGYTVSLPDEVHAILDERTNPTWPTTWFAPNQGSGPFKDAYSVMAAWGANHGALAYGHIGGELITLASLLRIPVYMHNVPEENLFRPHAWHSFGTTDPEGADFRACKAFGPLYGSY